MYSFLPRDNGACVSDARSRSARCRSGGAERSELCSGDRALVLRAVSSSSMTTPCLSAAVAMDLGVCQLRNFSISFLSSLLSAESSHCRLDNGSSGASVVAIDNKIEQAMDLVKSHLMYAVREEVEVLKEQIKELIERNSQLEQENSLLKTLASPQQMAQFQAQVQSSSSPAPAPPPPAPQGGGGPPLQGGGPLPAATAPQQQQQPVSSHSSGTVA